MLVLPLWEEDTYYSMITDTTVIILKWKTGKNRQYM